SRDDLANAIFEWIECWYNPKRRHSAIGMASPADYDTTHPVSVLRGQPQRRPILGGLHNEYKRAA
ncbi:MAG: IS3 family transposase, partial [Frankia sp.]